MRIERYCLALLLAAGAAGRGRADAPAVPSDLADYVNKADDSFAWKLKGKTESDLGTVYDLTLTSQTWHDVRWDHGLQVFLPKGTKPTRTVVLWNQGGSPSPNSALLGIQIAQKVGGPVAFLYGIPNQPLFGGKREDALIAETFVRYLETKDSSWPLLFPMVKSLIRAMDTLQAFAVQEWKAEVTGFVVTGASKRGWTSWLTAATGDKRVKAIAPLVIDTLNIPVQMENQKKAFGKPSEMIRDYVDRKLVPVPDTPEGRKLWTMIDPWVYRDRVTVPKMVINGSNDPYWPLDALNTYWDDLKGEKYLLYVPNAGHDLRERNADGRAELIPTRALNTLAAFCKSQVFDKPMPRLGWVCKATGEECELGINSGTKAKAVRVWRASADTRDFRKARWSVDPQLLASGNAPVKVTAPAKGFVAFFAECDYEIDGLTFTLSTQLQILEAKK